MKHSVESPKMCTPYYRRGSPLCISCCCSLLSQSAAILYFSTNLYRLL